jgi:hypothetical protein
MEFSHAGMNTALRHVGCLMDDTKERIFVIYHLSSYAVRKIDEMGKKNIKKEENKNEKASFYINHNSWFVIDHLATMPCRG